MSKIIVYTNLNGNVSVCMPTQESIESHGIEWIKEKDTPENSIIIDSSELPQDSIFFNAWELNGSAITVNLDKAKDITKDHLRQERVPLLQAHDVAFQRALETGTDTSSIIAEKQRLRDITKLADEATTIQELKAIVDAQQQEINALKG